jgi:hypothetical protein
MSNISSTINPAAVTFAPVSAVQPLPTAGVSRRIEAAMTGFLAMVHCELFGKRYRRTLSPALHEI